MGVRTSPVRGSARAVTPDSFASHGAPPPYTVVAPVGQI